MKVLVTGARGFVGKSLVLDLRKAQWQVVAAVRNSPKEHDEISVGDIDAETKWLAALQGCDTVIHLAARVHIMRDSATDPLAAFRLVNVEGTLNLARQAVQAGVRRFVFLSSIKVNGESTRPGIPFTANDRPAPDDAYAISKYEAEQGLLALASNTGMEVVIIRPPLVYGPGVKANFRSMMNWLAKGVPLPLGAIHNKRSLVSLDNLVSLIMTCLTEPRAANQVFLVSDGEDLSTTELLRRLAAALGQPARLIPVSAKVLDWGARLFGKGDVARRLCGNLQVDISKTRELLGWEPPITVEEGLRRVADDFLHESGFASQSPVER
jgi:nucleoside-diphosphate-sugar epimerase